MNFNLTPTNQIYIPLNKPGTFQSAKQARAHRDVVQLAQNLRKDSQTAIEQLRGADRFDFSATPSETGVDLSNEKGHVIVLAEDKAGNHDFDLRFNPENGRVSSFEATLPEGTLTQGPELGGNDGISSTYKWEDKFNGQPRTTFFKFDDKAGMLTILDPDHKDPAILNGIDPHLLEGGFVSNPLTIFTF